MTTTGYHLACEHIADRIGLSSLLRSHFDERRAQDLLTVSSFVALGCPGGITGIDFYSKTCALSGEKSISWAQLQDLLYSIKAQEKDNFLAEWRKHLVSNYECSPFYVSAKLSKVHLSGNYAAASLLSRFEHHQSPAMILAAASAAASEFSDNDTQPSSASSANSANLASFAHSSDSESAAVSMRGQHAHELDFKVLQKEAPIFFWNNLSYQRVDDNRSPLPGCAFAEAVFYDALSSLPLSYQSYQPNVLLSGDNGATSSPSPSSMDTTDSHSDSAAVNPRANHEPSGSTPSLEESDLALRGVSNGENGSSFMAMSSISGQHQGELQALSSLIEQTLDLNLLQLPLIVVATSAAQLRARYLPGNGNWQKVSVRTNDILHTLQEHPCDYIMSADITPGSVVEQALLQWRKHSYESYYESFSWRNNGADDSIKYYEITLQDEPLGIILSNSMTSSDSALGSANGNVAYTRDNVASNRDHFVSTMGNSLDAIGNTDTAFGKTIKACSTDSSAVPSAISGATKTSASAQVATSTLAHEASSKAAGVSISTAAGVSNSTAADALSRALDGMLSSTTPLGDLRAKRGSSVPSSKEGLGVGKADTATLVQHETSQATEDSTTNVAQSDIAASNGNMSAIAQADHSEEEGVRCRLIMYQSAAHTYREQIQLQQLLAKWEQELREKSSLQPEEIANYSHFFNITCDSTGAFTFCRNQEKVTRAFLLCGCVAIWCSRFDLKARTVWAYYQAHKQYRAIAQSWSSLAPQLLARHDGQSTTLSNSCMLVEFLALILRTSFKQQLSTLPALSRPLTLPAALEQLRGISCIKARNAWQVKQPLIAEQELLVKTLHLPINLNPNS